MKFSKINAWLHLWLGLISGIIVFIVSITGCILVFEHDLKDLLYPYRKAAITNNGAMLPPSALISAAEKAMGGMPARSIEYRLPGKTTQVNFQSDSIVYVNPYTAEVAAVVDHEDFFHEVEEGHVNLWLPRKIGTRIVTYATLIFTILLITGMVLWWPKKWNRHNIRNAFTILWKGKFKRVNYDLHNVLGFYTLPVALIIAYSGLYMGFGWLSRSVYTVASGGKSMPAYYEPPSDTTMAAAGSRWAVLDGIWRQCVNELADKKSPAVLIGTPPGKNASVYAYTNMEGAYYQAHYFDQYSGKKLQGGGVDVMPFSEANGGDKLRRLNYSLHVGSIWGIPSKILFFLGSLVAASLPVTGFYIWWGKKKKKKKPALNRQQQTA